MNKKFYIISIAATLFIAICIVFIFTYVNNKNKQKVPAPSSQQQEDYSKLPIEELSEKPNLQIQTSQGTVVINNVYKKPVEELSKNGVAFSENSDYFMAFYPQDNGFLISINNSDVVAASKKAEREFLTTLNITEEQACDLKVSITVSYDVNEKYSGGVYGFSFCSNVNHLE